MHQHYVISCKYGEMLHASCKYDPIYQDKTTRVKFNSGYWTVDSIVKNINRRQKYLHRQARNLDVKSKMSLCSALVQCHLDSACSAWYSGLSKTLEHMLQMCQNRMVRFILDMSPRESINYNVLSSIEILNIEDRVKQLRLNQFV